MDDPKHMKFDQDGNYLDYYGYTSVSMCKENQNLEEAVRFLKTSEVLRKFYSPLPTNSFHMTLFDIYTTNARPVLKVVQLWEKKGNKIPEDSLLPREVLGDTLDKAQRAVESIMTDFETTWTAHFMKEFKPTEHLYLLLKPNDEVDGKIKSYRSECSKLFEGKKQSDLGYHLTLAYRYKTIPEDKIEEVKGELKKFNDHIRDKTGDTIKFYRGDVNWFKDMTAFPKLE